MEEEEEVNNIATKGRGPWSARAARRLERYMEKLFASSNWWRSVTIIITFLLAILQSVFLAIGTFVENNEYPRYPMVATPLPGPECNPPYSSTKVLYLAAACTNIVLAWYVVWSMFDNRRVYTWKLGPLLPVVSLVTSAEFFFILAMLGMIATANMPWWRGNPANDWLYECVYSPGNASLCTTCPPHVSTPNDLGIKTSFVFCIAVLSVTVVLLFVLQLALVNMVNIHRRMTITSEARLRRHLKKYRRVLIFAACLMTFVQSACTVGSYLSTDMRDAMYMWRQVYDFATVTPSPLTPDVALWFFYALLVLHYLLFYVFSLVATNAAVRPTVKMSFYASVVLLTIDIIALAVYGILFFLWPRDWNALVLYILLAADVLGMTFMSELSSHINAVARKLFVAETHAQNARSAVLSGAKGKGRGDNDKTETL